MKFVFRLLKIFRKNCVNTKSICSFWFENCCVFLDESNFSIFFIFSSSKKFSSGGVLSNRKGTFSNFSKRFSVAFLFQTPIETKNQITLPHSMVKNIEKQRAKHIYRKEKQEDPPGVSFSCWNFSPIAQIKQNDTVHGLWNRRQKPWFIDTFPISWLPLNGLMNAGKIDTLGSWRWSHCPRNDIHSDGPRTVLFCLSQAVSFDFDKNLGIRHFFLQDRTQPALVACKRSTFNHYPGRRYLTLTPKQIASNAWQHRLSKGDHFTIDFHNRVVFPIFH